MRHWGNSAGATGRIRDLRAGVRHQSYKVYKESVFLYNNKKTKGYKSGYIYKTLRYCFTCKQVPDQTGRQDREKGIGKGGECAACRKEVEWSSPSINLQAGAVFTHAQEKLRSKVCAVLAVCG